MKNLRKTEQYQRYFAEYVERKGKKLKDEQMALKDWLMMSRAALVVVVLLIAYVVMIIVMKKNVWEHCLEIGLSAVVCIWYPQLIKLFKEETCWAADDYALNMTERELRGDI